MSFSATDYSFLSTHGFLAHYDRYRDRLLAIAKGTYQLTKAMSGLAISPSDCESLIEAALIRSTVFADIVADLCTKINFPGPKDPYWPDFFAGPIARFVTDREWQDIAI